MCIFSIGENPSIIFNYSEFLADVIGEQFLKFSTKGAFKYALVLLYLFLFHHAYIFHFPLQKLDEQGNTQFVIQWTSLARKHSNEFTFNQYVDQFLYTVSCILNSNVKPRIGSKIKEFLYLSECGAVTRVFFTSSYLTLYVNPGTFCYCKG